MNTPTRHHRANVTRIAIESLEKRQLLTTFGTPWPEQRSLTISFPADGVAIGNSDNDIRQTFDAVTDRDNWQELALRAFQTWSVYADINVGLRNDYDLDFGVPGLSVQDPRFGDFRVGAFPQTGVLANTIPFQTIAGTYSGDVLLNSSEAFTYHDWTGSVAPDPNSQVPGQHDLFSVLLHETGNALGIDDNLLDWTVMFRQYTVPKGALSQHDIDELQSLYGARTDPYEFVGNDQLQLSTLIPTPVGFQPATDVITAGGSLQNASDIDYYEVTPVAGNDSVTIRLRASGISLVKTRLEVLDAAGQVIGVDDSDSVFANDNMIQISGLQNHSALYVRVSPLDQDVFSVGDYRLEVDYRSADTQAADLVPGDYDAGVDSLFTNFALVDTEQGANDTLSNAETVDSTADYSPQSRYEILSAVSASTDLDYWKVTAPANADGRLVINISGVGLAQPDLRVQVVDADGQSVGTAGRIRADGTWTIEVAQPQAAQNYYLRVSVDPNSTVGVGNYVATAEFETTNAQMHHLVSGQASSTIDDLRVGPQASPSCFASISVRRARHPTKACD